MFALTKKVITYFLGRFFAIPSVATSCAPGSCYQHIDNFLFRNRFLMWPLENCGFDPYKTYKS